MFEHKHIVQQVEDLTENKHILDKYTISLFQENIVSKNIKIGTGESCTDFSKTPFKQKVASGTGDYFMCIYIENSPVKTALCFFAFLRLQMICKF